jgi:hypothetical protein
MAKKAPDEPTKSRAFVLVVFAAILYLIAGFGVIATNHQFLIGDQQIVKEHFPVVMGLPLAAALSFLIVILLPQAYGKIEFKIVGMSIKGAAGPVVLWVLCFLVIAAAVKLLW